MTDAAITIRRGERLYGPYSGEQIREMLRTGSVVLEDEAWIESIGRWSTLMEITGDTSLSLNSGSEPVQTLDSLLGNQPVGDSVSVTLVPTKRDRLANILSAVGLVAIILGTIDLALHMKGRTEATRATLHEGTKSSVPSPQSDQSAPTPGYRKPMRLRDDFE
jgi:hypothetical protein